MKLVIQTQIRENYAAHNEDYVHGTSEARWKYKGGNSYVVENINPPTARNIEMDGIPTLKALIEDYNESFEEYILDWSLEDDDAATGEAWETPIMLEFDKMLKGWRATKVTLNGEYGYMRSEIAEKHESWMMLPEKDGEHKVMWVMSDGHRGIGNKFLEQRLQEAV
tara:strand:- start:8591 stop:9088 length:498 start_codon:yes stop_codon:yes gene_type:complete